MYTQSRKSKRVPNVHETLPCCLFAPQWPWSVMVLGWSHWDQTTFSQSSTVQTLTNHSSMQTSEFYHGQKRYMHCIPQESIALLIPKEALALANMCLLRPSTTGWLPHCKPLMRCLVFWSIYWTLLSCFWTVRFWRRSDLAVTMIMLCSVALQAHSWNYFHNVKEMWEWELLLHAHVYI